MELGLGHRLDQAPQRATGERLGPRSSCGRCTIRRGAVQPAGVARSPEGSSHVHRPRHRRQRLRRQPPRARAWSAAGHRVVALVRTPTPGRDGPRPAARPAERARVETRIGDVTRPATLAPGDGRRRRRRPPGRDPARLQRWRGPAPGQHRGHAARRRRDEGGRRPASRPHGRAGRRRRPDTPLRELEGEGRGARPRVGPRLDDPQAVAPVRRGRRLLQHHRRPRPARRPGSSRCRATAKARFQPIHVDDVAAVVVRSLADPTIDRRVVRARRSALLDLPRDHPRGRLRARQAARDRADADPAHPARRRDRGAASASRSPSPPTSCASSSSTTSGRSTSSRRASASSRGRWTGRSAISGTGSATRSSRRLAPIDAERPA